MPISRAIHCGQIAGLPIRFHAPPHDEPDFPWLELEDLLGLLSLPSDQHAFFMRALQRDWSGSIATIATDRGIRVVVPHDAVHGIMDAWIEAGLVDAATKDGYLSEGMKACRMLTAGFAPSDRIAYMLAAFAREG